MYHYFSILFMPIEFFNGDISQIAILYTILTIAYSIFCCRFKNTFPLRN